MTNVFLKEHREEWAKFMERCFAPTPLSDYVGVPDHFGMFIGIEPDGYTHS
jgi:hypothetical protein